LAFEEIGGRKLFIVNKNLAYFTAAGSYFAMKKLSPAASREGALAANPAPEKIPGEAPGRTAGTAGEDGRAPHAWGKDGRDLKN
jgi:hypothetical protein